MKAGVSILIVAFNQIDYIDEAIESAVNQDYPGLEIVVSDDGSQDGTSDLVASWQSRFPDRVVAVLNRDNVGVTANCNRGLRRCSGHYITWMGGDDVLLPGKVAAQVNWLERNRDRVLCGHPILVMRADGSNTPNVIVPQVKEGAGPEAFIRGAGILPLQSVMVRAEAVPAHGFDERVRTASDLLFCIEVLSRGGKFGCLNEPYYKYRHVPDSVSTRYAEMALDLERTFMIAGDRYPEYRQMCRDAIIEHVMYYGGVRQLNWGNKHAAREQFLRVIRAKPTFAKAWMRLLQTV